MKTTLRIVKLLVILIISVSVILFSVASLLQDKVANIILMSINKNISTKLEVGSFKLSFLRKFPKASLELKDVLVHSSPGFNSEAFGEINTDTLLTAGSMSVEFSISDIMKGIYQIDRIGARSGKIFLYSDTAGHVNYNISVKNEGTSTTDFKLNLEKIYLTDIRINYYNLSTKLTINGLVRNGKLRSRISGDNIDFYASSDIHIDTFHLNNLKIEKPIAAKVDIDLQNSKNGIMIKEGNLGIENYKFGIEGSISAEEMLDLKIIGKNIDLAKIRNYLPEKYLKLLSEYNPSGIVMISSNIKGLINPTSSPHIEINCILNDGKVSYGKSNLAINDVSFTGNFSNGPENCMETSTISFRNIHTKLGSAEFNGFFSVSNLNNPRVELELKGKIFPKELKDFFGLQEISSAGGYADLDLKLVCNSWPKEKFVPEDIFKMNPEANLDFRSFSIGFKNDKFLLSNVNGNLSVADVITARNISFDYKAQQIKIDGEFRNLPEWIIGKQVMLIASADVAFSRLIPELFIKASQETDKSDINKTRFVLPDYLMLDLSYKIDSLNYKTFSSSDITGTLNYEPGLLTFKTLNLKSLNGLISGNGFIAQNRNNSVVAKGSFNISEIDVNEAFLTFKNFGQNFLKAENIEGTLSGSVSILIPMDSLLNPQIKSITAEGNYLLTDGALINFEPVKQLSSFIEISELENIHFEKLENDFFIKSNFLYIPQMDVKSSAADLIVNGKHSFDNNYEYHVKMLLSEILSKKRKKSNVSEFGVVKDDGLGRTSLLLKITGEGENVKVGYDIKAAGNDVKKSIITEKKTIKTIMNQEYGWFKNDTTVKPKIDEKKPRFKIVWEENDSVKVETDTQVLKKESAVKSIFRKK